MLKEKKSYRALIKNRYTCSLDEIVERMVRRNPGLTGPEIKGILEVFMEEVSGVLKEGGSVITPLFKARCSIAGLFDGADDYFFRNRHQVRASLKPGSLLLKMAGQVRPRKAESNLPKPYISQVTDMGTGKVNAILTPGGPVMISGARLQFDPDDPEQGVFWVSESRQLFRAAAVLHNTFSRLILMVPVDLPAGTYQLQVKSNLKTQTIRTGELDRPLTVE